MCWKVLGVSVCCLCSIVSAYTGNAKNHLVSYVQERLPSIHGWCSEEKAESIMELILEQKPKVCVEIGVFGGSSIFPTAVALRYNRIGKVWAIDPWNTEECLKGTTNPAHRDWWNSFKMEDIYSSFQKMLKDESLTDQCIVLRMNSKAAISHVPAIIDVLHIDGNHSEAASFFDAKNYIPKVRQGGFIWFDDVDGSGVRNGRKRTQKGFEFALSCSDLIKVIDNGNCVLLRKR